MNWNILQRSKIFHFWWKIFHFGEILFSASRPSRLPNFIPNWEIGNFSTLVGNFPLSKICKKKIFLQNCMNWNILQRELFSEKSEIFPLFPKTRKFGKFIYSGLQLNKVSAEIIFSKNGHPSSGILSEIFQFLSLKSEFFLIFWKKVTIFENSEILYTFAYKCAKFQQNQRNFFSSSSSSFIIIHHHHSSWR